MARAGLAARPRTVPGLVLEEPDFITLAEELAVRAVPSWQEILDLQLARTANPDRQGAICLRAAGAVVRRRASATRSSTRLGDVQNRRREPWVLEGLAYLHHPLRASSSRKHIPQSLALLQEIRRTGDIFFPKRWMDATLSGHRSASAAQMVRQFLAHHPARLSGPAAPHDPVVGRRSVPRRPVRQSASWSYPADNACTV